MHAPIITHTGRCPLLLLTLAKAPTILRCTQPGCTFAVSATTDGQAIRSLAAHLTSPVHLPRPEGQ